MNDFSQVERAAIYRIIAARRDVRRGFLPEPLADDVLARILSAAHAAPSVGLMQPSRFVLVRDINLRGQVYEAFADANRCAAAGYDEARGAQYAALKLAGLQEAPQHLCVLCEGASAQGYGLGRQTMPEMAAYSTVCAVENLWLAARAEGVGVGWVSILDPARLHAILGVPAHLAVVAYLCLGYVDRFGDSPELEQAGWEHRRALALSVDGCDPTW